ncbi:uncharacterized protein LOC117558146 [Gymnodraco acuticeps]|uniref:Uncharacterized protein LOC117558146 n=1 Tax=Gymnodraco acuticeps TaxID=8218 RepID=A0A6P8VHT6_GYMAC|nr:uncharacterized protein LOC117558146 [Gymnodraco acuticeps]
MRDRLYKVSICMGDDGAMQSAVCDCARGMYKCSHAAALAIFAMWQISSTDVECQWRKPGTSKVVQPVSQLYQQQEETYNPLARDIATQDVDWFRSALRGTQCGMAWLLSPEPEPQPQHQAIVTVPELVKEHGGRGLEAILASMRQQQRTNPQWQLHRQDRLTASNFGAVLRSGLSSTPCASLMKRVLGGYNLDGVMAVNWGVVNEAEGVKAFVQAYRVTVIDAGLFVSESGVLGASPDGLVQPSALLEVKCPHSQRNMTIAEAVQLPSFCLREEGGSYVLKENHPYWHQVQGQLHITDRSICYFVVWTTKEAIVIPINKDPAWHGNRLLLENTTLSICSLCWPVERRTYK